MDREALGYWNRIAGAWRIGAPLAPSAADLSWFQEHISNVERRTPGGLRRALLLGVTPGLAMLDWPPQAKLMVIDWAAEIFRHRWPSAGLPPGVAPVRADWRQLPVAGASVDMVSGDGCYTALAPAADARLLTAEVHRVLRPGGLLCLRAFVRSARVPPASELFERLRAGEYADLDVFRWLLAMAVQGDSRDGVALGEVWQAWKRNIADPSVLAGRLGWSEQAAGNLERWRGQAMRFTFHSLEELCALLRGRFELLECQVPDEPLGEHFPRLCWRSLG
jgi:SAM-dependent methyltransferase